MFNSILNNPRKGCLFISLVEHIWNVTNPLEYSCISSLYRVYTVKCVIQYERGVILAGRAIPSPVLSWKATVIVWGEEDSVTMSAGGSAGVQVQWRNWPTSTLLQLAPLTLTPRAVLFYALIFRENIATLRFDRFVLNRCNLRVDYKEANQSVNYLFKNVFFFELFLRCSINYSIDIHRWLNQVLGLLSLCCWF